MALNANCVANVTTTGSDDNAGWFDTTSGDAAGGANDRAFSNSPIVIDGATITASVHTTTTQATLVGHTLASTDRGNVLRISGGTATAGYYRITSVDTANNRVTVDASMGTSGQTITGRIGGAFASPGQASGTTVNNCEVRVRPGIYLIGTGTANTPGNRVLARGQNVKWIGYDGVLGAELVNKPVLKATATSQILFDLAQAGEGGDKSTLIRNISVDGDGLASVIGFRSRWDYQGRLFHWCSAYRCPTAGFDLRSAIAVGCYSESCGVGFTGTFDEKNDVQLCVAKSCTTGFSLIRASQCTALSCTTGFDSQLVALPLSSCVAYGGTTGFRIDNDVGKATTLTHCISYGATTAYAVTAWGSLKWTTFINCAGGGSLDATYIRDNIGFTTLTADPFVNAAGGDFALNDVAGGGATLKALNFALPGISTTRYPFGGWAPPRAAGPLIGRGGLIY